MYEPAHLTVGSIGCQLGEGLLARSAHPHQQGVAAVYADDAVNSGQVLQGVVKQNQLHLRLRLVVLLQDLLQARTVCV